MDKWQKLKTLIKAKLSWTVHLSGDRNYQKVQLEDILETMEAMEKEEVKQEAQNKEIKGFLFTDIPEFDKATWKKMLENLEGLS